MPDRRLRVALVNHGARMGGGEFALLGIAQNLDRRSVDALVVLGEEGPLADRLRAVGVEVVVRPLDRRVLDRRKDALGATGLAHPLVAARAAAAAAGLTRLLRARRIDVVHTNTLKAHLLGGLAGRLARARVVWHVRDHLASPYLPAAAVPLVRRAARLVADRVVAVSASAASTVGRSDVVVIHQGVGIPHQAGERSPDGRPRVGLVGRIAPWKGQDVFVATAAQLAPEFPDAEFVLAGSPLFGEEPFEAQLRRQVASLGLGDRVRFLGFCEDVWEVYRDLDVVVHASTLAEPYGNVVLEAMASRRALVAAGAGGVLELVEDGVTGLLTPPGDADALAGAVGRLLRCPDERRRIADAGRRHVEQRFSLERDARALEGVWREVVAAREHGRPGRVPARRTRRWWSEARLRHRRRRGGR